MNCVYKIECLIEMELNDYVLCFIIMLTYHRQPTVDFQIDPCCTFFDRKLTRPLQPRDQALELLRVRKVNPLPRPLRKI